MGCSPDSTASHRDFIAKFNIRVTLLSDPDKKAMGPYGAWGEKKLYGKTTVGVIRSTVLIDPGGNVAHHWKSVKAQGHAGYVHAKLTELRA